MSSSLPESRRLSKAPLIPILLINFGSLFMFLTAPIDWGSDNATLLAVLVVISQVAIYIGFKLGFGRGTERLPVAERKFNPGETFLLLLILYALSLPIHYSYIAKTAVMAPGDLLGFFQYAWTDPSIGRRIVLDPELPRTVAWRLFFVISLFNRFFFTIGFILWDKIGSRLKVALAVMVAIEIWFWLAAGTTFGIVVVATNYLFARIVTGRESIVKAGVSIKGAAVYVVVGALSLFMFLFNIYSRSGREFLETTGFSIEDLGVAVNSDSIAFKIIPDALLSPYMYVLSYLCQGYYHTSLAFELEFLWTGFFGSIPAVMDFGGIVGVNQWERTYMYRLGSHGVDPLRNWHSAYLWYANDVTFFGIPFLLGGIGFLLGFGWARSLGGDLISKLMFVVFGNALFFLWANNTYLSTVFYPLMFILPYWFFTRVMGQTERRWVAG